MKDEIKLFYDINAEKIANEWYGKSTMMPNIKEFIDMLAPKPKVLDLGCGPGYESMRLSSLGAEVVGIDYSEESIRVARERCPDIKFIVRDFRYLDARLGMFDAIFACASLIHSNEQELHTVFEGLRKVMEPKGYLMVILRDGRGVLERPYQSENEEFIRRIYLYSKETFSTIALHHDFKFVKESELEDNVDENRWRCFIYQYSIVEGKK